MPSDNLMAVDVDAVAPYSDLPSAAQQHGASPHTVPRPVTSNRSLAGAAAQPLPRFLASARDAAFAGPFAPPAVGVVQREILPPLPHFEPGDLVTFHRGAYHHVAVYVGNGVVIHLWNKKGAAEIAITNPLEDLVADDPTASHHPATPATAAAAPAGGATRNRDFKVQYTLLDEVRQGATVVNETAEYDEYMFRKYGRRPLALDLANAPVPILYTIPDLPAAGGPVTLTLAHPAVRKAHEKLGQSSYHLLRWNCEHFATWARYGAPVCRQVQQHAMDVFYAAKKGLQWGGLPGMILGALYIGLGKLYGNNAVYGISAASVEAARASDGDPRSRPGNAIWVSDERLVETVSTVAAVGRDDGDRAPLLRNANAGAPPAMRAVTASVQIAQHPLAQVASAQAFAGNAAGAALTSAAAGASVVVREIGVNGASAGTVNASENMNPQVASALTPVAAVSTTAAATSVRYTEDL